MFTFIIVILGLW